MTDYNYVFDFVIPQGPPGAQGPQGPAGDSYLSEEPLGAGDPVLEPLDFQIQTSSWRTYNASGTRAATASLAAFVDAYGQAFTPDAHFTWATSRTRLVWRGATLATVDEKTSVASIAPDTATPSYPMTDRTVSVTNLMKASASVRATIPDGCAGRGMRFVLAAPTAWFFDGSDFHACSDYATSQIGDAITVVEPISTVTMPDPMPEAGERVSVAVEFGVYYDGVAPTSKQLFSFFGYKRVAVTAVTYST